jgi:hypothetical protein
MKGEFMKVIVQQPTAPAKAGRLYWNGNEFQGDSAKALRLSGERFAKELEKALRASRDPSRVMYIGEDAPPVLPFRREVVPGWTTEEILAREG